jgi:hypothetical protein
MYSSQPQNEQHEIEMNPFIGVDLRYIPVSYLSKEMIQQNAIALLNRTPFSESFSCLKTFQKKSNRIEKLLVESSMNPYNSPFVIEKNYWNTITNYNLFQLRGLDNHGSICIWKNEQEKNQEKKNN